MNNKHFGLLFVGLVLVVFLAVNFVVQRKDLTLQDNETNTSREDLIREEENKPKQTIDVKYQYRDGAHIFVGKLDLPTTCHDLKNKVVTKDQVTEIYLDVVDSGEICAQVISPESYVVNVLAPKDQTIIFYLNNEVVNLNIYEIPDDQDINEIIIFNKG